MKKGCSEIYLSPQPFQVLTFKFLHSYCFIERFFAEEFHGAFCHLAAFVGSAFYDAFLPVEGNAEFFGFLLAGIEVMEAAFHAVLALCIGLGGRAERLLSGNVLASHQHDDGESKGRSQIGIGKAEALCAVRVAGGIVRHREPSRIGADDGIDVRSSIKKAVAMHELAAGRMAENDDLSLGMGSCADSGNDMVHGIEGPVVSWLDRSFLAFLVLHVSS